MSFKILYEPSATEDIDNIFRYISKNLCSPQSATNQVRRIVKGIDVLRQDPEGFRLYPIEPWKSRNLRIMPVDNYLVLYIPDRMKKTVSIMSVLYGARNIENYLLTKGV